MGFYSHTHRHSHGTDEHRHQHSHPRSGRHGSIYVDGPGGPESAPNHKHDHSSDYLASTPKPAVTITKVGATAYERERFRQEFRKLAKKDDQADALALAAAMDMELHEMLRIVAVFKTQLNITFSRKED